MDDTRSMTNLLFFKRSGLQYSHRSTDSYHRITLILKKTFKQAPELLACLCMFVCSGLQR